MASPPVRPWGEMQHDLLVAIMSRVGAPDLLSGGAPRACSAWWAAARDPLAWRRVDLRDWTALTSARRAAGTRSTGGNISVQESLAGVLEVAATRADGRMETVLLPEFADEEHLLFLAESQYHCTLKLDDHEGTLHGNTAGQVTVTSPGNLSAAGLQSVVVRGGGGGTVSFTLCGDATAEGVSSASFAQCGATRVDGARTVSALRCKSVDVEQAGKVTLERCREARLRGGGLLRATRCRRADVESFGEVRHARCKAVRADWCGSVEVEMCRYVDVSRCGAVTGDRCRVVNVSGCGSVAVTHAVVKMLEEKQMHSQSQQPLSPHSSDSE